MPSSRGNSSNHDNGGQASNSGTLSLERKLELLESRFTQPALPSLDRANASNPWSNSAFGNTNTGTPSKDTGRMSPTSNHSQHSFRFPSINSNESSNPLPHSSVRSRKRPTLNASFHSVSMAAARHIRKVAATSPVLGMSASNFSNTNSSSSNQTLLTSHVQQNPPQPAQRIVAESPPVIVSPHMHQQLANQNGPPKPKVARNILPSSTSAKGNIKPTAVDKTNNNDGTPGKNTNMKRKSVPKRKQSSILDKSVAANENVPNQNTTNSNMAKSPAQSTRKKTRLEDAASRSPRWSATSSFSELSRDRSNPSKAKRPAEPPANNRRIHDFFTVATNTNTKQGKAGNKSGINKQPTTLDGTNNGVATLMAGAVASATATNIVDWQAKCQKLQQQLQDKEEQLKAVTNNKTILHTALQAALDKTKKELAQVQKEQTKKSASTAHVLEELLRWKASQQAKEIRERLAANSSRLGRIVVSRAGMRAVESWEEGYATKDLESRKSQLVQKQKHLDARLYVAQQSDENQDKLEAMEAKEALQMHLTNCKSALLEIRKEEEALNDEKAAHIRALKLVASEDASRFRTRPKLHDRYILHCLLGKGGFSEVWKGYDLVELREVAVKIHQLDPRWPDSKKDNYTKHVSREYEIHRNVRHQRIVSLFDVFEIDNNSFATVLECCKGTDLDTLLKSKKRLPERQARAILLQILAGMRYLSEPSNNRQGIIHYDLKPGNILFDEMGDAKITDFGLSKIVDAPDPAESMELTSQGAGTYWYLPPECFITDEKVRISNKVDVWSIGVIYYQMLFGIRPFGEGKSQDKLLRDHTMLNAAQVHFSDRAQVSAAGKQFIQQCLTYDQAFRPTIAQLCENPYVLQETI